MKNTKFLILPIIMFIAASCGQTPSVSVSNSGESIGDSTSIDNPSTSTSTGTSTPSVSVDPGDYYGSISDSLSGSQLTSALNKLNTSKRKRTIGYKQHRNYFQYTEIVPGNTPSGKMYGYYNNALVCSTWDSQATWNHEHVWPDSLGGNLVEADIHMVRPTSVSINSGRGNKYYATDVYDPGQYNEVYRGIAARIIFYCCIANTSLNLVDKTSGGSNQMGKLSDLLKWNLEYLPTSSTTDIALLVEQNRNEVIEKNSLLQGNRNPFIDHPEYACRIWGNTNATTQSICSGK